MNQFKSTTQINIVNITKGHMGVLVYRSCSASISLLLISNRKKSSLISWGNIWAQRLNPPLSCLFISSCLHVKSLCEPDVVKGALKCFPCDVFVLASPIKKRRKSGPLESATLRWLGNDAQILNGVSLLFAEEPRWDFPATPFPSCAPSNPTSLTPLWNT